MPPTGIAANIVSGYALVGMATVGDNLRRIRGRRDQKAIATRMGVPQSQLSNWEGDRYKTLTLKTLLALAKGYECTVEEIVTDVDDEYGDRRDLIRQGETAKIGSSERGSNVPALAKAEDRRLESLSTELRTAAAQIAARLVGIAGRLTTASASRSDSSAESGASRRRRAGS